MSKIKLTLFILLFLFAGGCCLFVFHRYCSATFTPAAYTETIAPTPKPFCGWYRIHGYSLSDSTSYTDAQIAANYLGDSECSLVLLEINLNQYQNCRISDYGLAQLNTILSATSAQRKGIILRFLYDWEGKAAQTEPSDIQTILTHMEQVGPIVNQYAADILTLQGIFVGDVAEMHSGNYTDSLADEKLLLHKLDEVIDPSIFLAVRTPQQLRQLTEDDSDGTLLARLGLFNDGMLGSNTDYGTYIQLPRETEIAYQNNRCNFVPNGGEVIVDNAYNDFERALNDLTAMHVSYLNCDYDKAVLDKWKKSTYTGSAPYDGCSGYDYITAHLGYNFQICDASMSFHFLTDKKAQFDIRITNTGFANCYKNYPVFWEMTNTNSREIVTLPVDTDTRTWQSQAMTTLSIPVDIRSISAGSYAIRLYAYDKDTDTYLPFSSTTKLGTLTISRF